MDKAKKEIIEKTELCETLENQINEFNFSNIDLNFLTKIQPNNCQFENMNTPINFFKNENDDNIINKLINKQTNIEQKLYDESDEESEITNQQIPGIKKNFILKLIYI